MTESPDDVHRVLPCKLSDESRIAKSRLLTQAWEDYETIEQEKKDRASQYSDALKDKRAEISKLVGELKSGAESRDVVCRWVEDFEHGVKRLIRQDTGDIVQEVTLTPDELQRPLEFNS
jgi:hypothetical protein